jgi:uncharacterized protein
MPQPLYTPAPGRQLGKPPASYDRLISTAAERTVAATHDVPPRSGFAWTMARGQVCRIVTAYGPQVVDLNLWNATNPKERFWASRTRQIHRSHVTTYDHLWSCLPYLRPLATITGDSIQYGRDADGAGCHDLLGTRCDPYMHRMLTGETIEVTCHSNLARAVAPFGLEETDVHDVLNVFQVTGLTPAGEYFVKPCPARAGDYLELFAEQDLLCAISTCPHGDMSVPVWGPAGADTPDICRGVQVIVYDPPPEG